MTALTDFLLARIAEDEDEIRYAIGIGESFPVDPARLLAGCGAQRRIVDEMKTAEYRLGMHAATVRFILGTLAAGYDDHPDYRDEWKP